MRTSPPRGPGERDAREWRDAYRRRRDALRRIHRRLLARMPASTLRAAAQDLGLAAAALDSGDYTLDVVAEFAMYNGRESRRGPTAIERFCREGLGIDDRGLDTTVAAFQGWLATARYAILEVRRVIPGCGARAVDRRRATPLRLMDLGLAETGVRGLTLATRIVRTDRFWMTTGSPLLVDDRTRADLLAADASRADGPGEDERTRGMISLCLSRGLHRATSFRSPC